MSFDMSISLNVVSDAAEFCDSLRRSAMRRRMRFILTWREGKKAGRARPARDTSVDRERHQPLLRTERARGRTRVSPRDPLDWAASLPSSVLLASLLAGFLSACFSLGVSFFSAALVGSAFAGSAALGLSVLEAESVGGSAAFSEASSARRGRRHGRQPLARTGQLGQLGSGDEPGAPSPASIT